MFTLGEIAKICRGKLIGCDPRSRVTGVVIDSREVLPGDLFVALKGERANGHDYLTQAYQNGAVSALLERVTSDQDRGILVDDAVLALQRLSQFHRARLSIPVVAVTGSVGKTTTKECIGILLSEVFKTQVGYRNWNNHLGVPLSLLRLNDQDQCSVIELGANHPGEIARLAHLAQPTVGVITGIQPVHLEGFKSLEGVYRAKLELAEYLARNGGVVITNGDDVRLLQSLKSLGVKIITFGTKPHCDFVLTQFVESESVIYFQINDEVEFRLKGHGKFNAMNAMAAVSVASYFNLDLHELSESWVALPSIEGRFQCERFSVLDLVVVDDSYNANPTSFKESVATFLNVAQGRRKIVVVGDMLELGETSLEWHRRLGALLARAAMDLVVGVGPLSKTVLESYQQNHAGGVGACFNVVESAGTFLRSQIREGDAVLIKGSNSLRLGEIKTDLRKLQEEVQLSV